MGCEVYANGDEIACKAGDGKVIAAFPDVCLTPPAPPAGPIPVPYPDTSFSKDMKKGSKTVKIKRKEVMLKDLSYYKTSPLGDETATKSQGAGFVTHVITGKTYFVSWSMDVLFEGKNVDRHTDITTSNHASPMANAATPMVNTAGKAPKNRENRGTRCSCCGGDPHTADQQYGRPPISHDEFYGTAKDSSPRLPKKDRNFLRALKDDPKCKHLLPSDPDKGECGKYYLTTEDEYNGIQSAWNAVRSVYKTKHGMPRGEADGKGVVAHRVPKAAGGCPIGEGNLAPTRQECMDKETKLSDIQKRRREAIVNKYGLS
ncbi:DUF4150 domain-containing protein [Pseudomonas farris]